MVPKKIDYGKNVNVHALLPTLFKKHNLLLMTIHFFAVDHAEHLEGRTAKWLKKPCRMLIVG